MRRFPALVGAVVTGGLAPLRRFVTAFATLLQPGAAEAEILDQGAGLLRALVAQDDWLPDAFAQPDPDRYRQYLLHCDSRERFSIVSFVWGPGQGTPIHDHTVWGLIGVLRGAEWDQRHVPLADGRLAPDGPPTRLEAGSVASVSPRTGDIHQVRNAFADRVSISIHVYGGNIGAIARSVLHETGARKPFVSGYSNRVLPNIWDAV